MSLWAECLTALERQKRLELVHGRGLWRQLMMQSVAWLTCYATTTYVTGYAFFLRINEQHTQTVAIVGGATEHARSWKNVVHFSSPEYREQDWFRLLPTNTPTTNSFGILRTHAGWWWARNLPNKSLSSLVHPLPHADHRGCGNVCCRWEPNTSLVGVPLLLGARPLQPEPERRPVSGNVDYHSYSSVSFS